MIFGIKNYHSIVYLLILLQCLIHKSLTFGDANETFVKTSKVSDHIVRKVENDEGTFKFSKENILMFSRMVSRLVSDLRKEIKHDLEKDEKCHKKLFRTSKKGSPLVVIYPDGSDEISLTSLLYEESEPWSSCRRSCIASRIRNCRVKNLCEVDSLIEEAYCYVPGSKCEETVKKIIEKHNSGVSNTPFDYDNENYADNEYHNVDNNGYEIDIDYESKRNVKNDEDMYFVNEEDKYYPSEGNDFYIDEKEEDKTDDDGEEKGNSEFWNEILNLILPLPEYDLEFIDDGPLIIDPVEYFYDYDREQVEGTTETDSAEISPKSSNGKKTCGKSSFSNKFKMFRIIGGREAIKGSWPWQVAILNRFKELFCGGTLIAPNWILTAAHCIKKVLYVRVGEHDISMPDGEVELKVLQSFKHPNFDLESVDSDIGLLKIPDIKQKGKLKSLTSACLPSPFHSLPVKKSCFALGWGKERETHIFGSDILKYVKVPIVSRKVCKRVYQDFLITKNMFCAGVLKGGADACEGDSGGPLLCQDENERWVLHGVTSFGEGCGERNRLGVYVKVSNYVQWINKIMDEN